MRKKKKYLALSEVRKQTAIVRTHFKRKHGPQQGLQQQLDEKGRTNENKKRFGVWGVTHHAKTLKSRDKTGHRSIHVTKKHPLLPRAVDIAVRRLRTWRHPPTRIRSPRTRRCPSTKVRGAITRRWGRRCPTSAKVGRPIGRMGSGRCPTAHEVAATAVRRGWAGGATTSELRHRDRFACLTASLIERLRDRAAVRIVEPRVWVVVVRLVRVEVRQGRDCVWVWLKLRSRVGRGRGCVSNRTSPRFWNSIEAGSARAVCWQGDAIVMGVEFWPLNLLICVTISVGLRKKNKKKNTRRDRSEATVWEGMVGVWGGEEENTHCCHSRPTASG